MASTKDPYGNTWADQWDYNNDNTAQVNPCAQTTTGKGGDYSKRERYTRKMEAGLGKTKSFAVTGMKKAKLGATWSFHWVKDKCNKATEKKWTLPIVSHACVRACLQSWHWWIDGHQWVLGSSLLIFVFLIISSEYWPEINLV